MITNIFFFLYFSLLHPLHLSVSDISHNTKNNSLEITQRIFADDLEDALRNRIGGKVDVYDPADPDLLSELIGDYVKQNFRISVDNKPVTLSYIGYETEEDAVWVYFEVSKVRDFSTISVKNTVFFEMFEDQLNLINVKKNGSIRSLKLEPDNEQKSLSYK